ncbi:MAG: NAD(P)H oxidoreductase YRKL @ Putative NADPH-quinone reductase (Modulator of drug activity B) @ Flavodoxin 2 [uncultured Campylobacterales bacterium]|uniref:NAD(P)H oxidoreductase YRKL @ Putative NADPH-quinone reductase (Modulator of drug activity B) @ Flavodoxin 2 n=1 Tax=uncultured Campylobacterales bacterium TaxID=352960 RepID=A0A6S6SJY1_9BACT|nr:MAG: NAD(P)H oxidoreductase YRKL @ Putative NADPH-quinone reductase (Modulator of drug activity B) @ Flavodoxin 2 [uncultured Campylobacterales bacterium]
MKNILIITAHPSSRNLTKEIASIYKKEKEKQNKKVELIDLYSAKQLEFLNFEDSNNIEINDTQKYYQEKIKNASEIVFVYPFWWGSMPAILKNWIDSVLTINFAAKYNGKGLPVGLLKGRSVKIIVTSGAPTFFYILNGIKRANKKIWKQTIVEFCGMKFDGYYLFGGMDTKGKNVPKMFKVIKTIAN